MSNHFFKTFKSDLRYVAESNVSEWDKTLVNYSTNVFGMNPLHLLCSIKNVKDRDKKITYLLDKDVDRSHVDSSGYLPVDYLLKKINMNYVIDLFDRQDFKSASPLNEERLIKNYIQGAENARKFMEKQIQLGKLTEDKIRLLFNTEISHLSRDLCNIYHIWNNTVEIIKILPDDLSKNYGKNTVSLNEKINDIISKINRRIQFTEPLSLETEMEKKTLYNLLSDNIIVNSEIGTVPAIRKVNRI